MLNCPCYKCGKLQEISKLLVSQKRDETKNKWTHDQNQNITNASWNGENWVATDEVSDPQGWVAADGRGLVAALRHPTGGRMKGRAQWRVCVSVWVHRVGCVTSACKSLHAHIHKQHQLHLSLTWESLMTEAQKPKKPPRPVSFPPFIFLPWTSLLSDRTLQHQCSIWSTQDTP